MRSFPSANGCIVSYGGLASWGPRGIDDLDNLPSLYVADSPRRSTSAFDKQMNKSLAVVAALLDLAGCASIPPAAQNACFHRNQAVETDIGYCQAVRSGHTLYISGIAAQGDMAAAIRSVYDRLKLTLEANKLSFANVVKENVYATDLDAFIQNKGIRKEFYGPTLPAATWVQVQRLYLPSLVLEVELTAEYP